MQIMGREMEEGKRHHPQSIVIKINPVFAECSRDPYYNFSAEKRTRLSRGH